MSYNTLINMPPVRVQLQLRDIPVLDFVVWRIIRPGHINTFHCTQAQINVKSSVMLNGVKDKPWWNNIRGSDHLYGLNCHAWPVVITQTTRSHASGPNLFRASTESTTTYLGEGHVSSHVFSEREVHVPGSRTSLLSS